MSKYSSESALDTVSSLPSTATKTDTKSKKAFNDQSNLFQFDVWNLIKRNEPDDIFILTTKYRCNKKRVRKTRSALVKRRQKITHPDIAFTDDTSNFSETTNTTSSTEKQENDNNDEELADSDAGEFDDFLDSLPKFEPIVKKETAGQSPVFRPVSAFEDIWDELLSPKSSATKSQRIYVKACKALQVFPSAFFVKNLRGFKIDMPHYYFGPQRIKACAIALSLNSTVQSLTLSHNDIGPEGAKYIAEMLRENHMISELNLSENGLGIEGALYILEVLMEFDNISKLDLSANCLRECDAEPFKNLLEKTRNLKSLNLSHNEFREKGGILLGKAIGSNDTLEELDLSWNHLRRSGSIGIGEGLEENITLKCVNLAWNGFYVEGCKSLAVALELNTNMTELNLSCNRINKECLDILMNGLKFNSTLKSLSLASNPLTSDGAYSLLLFIEESETSAIEFLDMGNQEVEAKFDELLRKVQKTRKLPLRVLHGPVSGQKLDEFFFEEEAILEENPAIVLIEYGKLMGFRMIDLFSSFDKNKDRSLDHDEIQEGLKLANIPLSDTAIEKLISKLDSNADGEIDFGELIEAQNLHRRLMTKLIEAREEGGDEAVEQTDIYRIRYKIHNLLAEKARKDNDIESPFLRNNYLLERLKCDINSTHLLWRENSSANVHRSEPATQISPVNPTDDWHLSS
ncbi:hypothetical protein CHS0354_014169 [Potamilus streckersoni]|uniref:EF-hand domain-containing protein n=1 Tax=Potamilus streckersoni TaxID=2493646 RepID=A0AAE0SNL1_9BIVA|nr:hypothetical protein CHS0354_014169 [Potamilus streckersoni]